MEGVVHFPLGEMLNKNYEVRQEVNTIATEKTCQWVHEVCYIEGTLRIRMGGCH
jgi:hypothetical protein